MKRISCRIDNVKHGQARSLLNMICHFVHGVRTQHNEIGASRGQRLAGRTKNVPGRRPVSPMLQGFDLGKIHTVENQSR